MKKNLLLLLPFIYCCSTQNKTVSSLSTSNEQYNYQKGSTLISLLNELPNETQLSFGFIGNNNINYLGLIKQSDKIDTTNIKNKRFRKNHLLMECKFYCMYLFQKKIK